jgi:phosphoinositide-3-kinase regulatory subunit 4
MKAEKTNFWRSHKRVASKLESPRESVISIRKSGSVIARNKSDEYVIAYMCSVCWLTSDFRDEAQLTKLQNLGMTSNDESKLLAMRDYILKLASAMSRLVA